ncbi:MAG TPA: NADH-quinone oxidoreductase subunit M, partial [Chitinophagaceae bacterium]
MLTVLLIAVPFLAGLTGFGIKGKSAKAWALISSIAILAIAIGAVMVFNGSPDSLHIDIPWIAQLGSRFNVGLDGMGVMLCLLTAIVFAVIFIATWHHEYKDPHRFYGLMLLSQAGLMGVFCAYDALLFYSFWELAIIPVYFLCSIWGGEK